MQCISRDEEICGVIEADAVDLEFRDVVKANVSNEVLCTVVAEVQILETGECSTECLLSVRTVSIAQVQLFVRKTLVRVVEDASMMICMPLLWHSEMRIFSFDSFSDGAMRSLV